jgi:hypothetical protein
MRRVRSALLLAFLLVLHGCTENSAPGNDREAELTPASPAAEVKAAAEAIRGVATSLLIPQTMTDADIANISEIGDPCVFRMTRVGSPVLVYGSAAVVKLNDRLVPLPATGGGRYAADGVTVAVLPLTDNLRNGEPFSAEFVLWLPGAANELGFHGFAEC